MRHNARREALPPGRGASRPDPSPVGPPRHSEDSIHEVSTLKMRAKKAPSVRGFAQRGHHSPSDAARSRATLLNLSSSDQGHKPRVRRGRRIAKSLIECPDKLQGLSWLPSVMVGPGADREVFRQAGDETQRGRSRVAEHCQSFRQTHPRTPLPALVPPAIFDAMEPVLNGPVTLPSKSQVV